MQARLSCIRYTFRPRQAAWKSPNPPLRITSPRTRPSNECSAEKVYPSPDFARLRGRGMSRMPRHVSTDLLTATSHRPNLKAGRGGEAQGTLDRRGMPPPDTPTAYIHQEGNRGLGPFIRAVGASRACAHAWGLVPGLVKQGQYLILFALRRDGSTLQAICFTEGFQRVM